MPTGHAAPDSSTCPGSSTGLILTGGGARAAYQVGALAALLEIIDPCRRHDCLSPFAVVAGTSAGAINAASLASHSHQVHHGITKLERLWGQLETGQVYEADALGLIGVGVRWLSVMTLGWLIPAIRAGQPQSLLDNSPLRRLLNTTINFSQIERNIAHDRLKALAITATAYNTGEHLTFYQSRVPIKPWTRSSRKAVPGAIRADHLMASSAIPFIFPAESLLVRGQTQWCGDGSMRQLAPLSPAIHLGAERVVVIGTAFNDDTHPEKGMLDPPYPTLAQIGGHTLSNIFIDSLSMDVERMTRINQLLEQMPESALAAQALRPVASLVITPSQSLEELAMQHLHELPRAARTLFRVLGVSSRSGSGTGGALMSYLLFEARYTKELIRLGRSDTFNRQDEVKAFFKESLA